MQEDDHAFVARFGNTVIRGSSFEAVGDALVERGFQMVKAVHVGPGEVEIPHSKPSRQPARLKAKLPEPTPEPEPVISQETTLLMARVEMATAAAMSGATPPIGDFGSRPCGAVHSDGVVCLIVVFIERVNDCECCGGEIVYHHEGPHEAADEDGVKYRWTAVTVIQDHEYNSYGPIQDEDSEAR
jgi:hypothetical protein